jgi:DNA helicase-2/ATP-dependent DNA helicase PcrA
VSVVRADNQAQRALEYRPAPADRRPLDLFVDAPGSLMVLTRNNLATQSLRSAFNRRLLLWEGHTRNAMENYVEALTAGNGDRNAVAAAVVAFIQDTAVGFTGGAFADTFTQDVVLKMLPRAVSAHAA